MVRRVLTDDEIKKSLLNKELLGNNGVSYLETEDRSTVEGYTEGALPLGRPLGRRRTTNSTAGPRRGRGRIFF